MEFRLVVMRDDEWQVPAQEVVDWRVLDHGVDDILVATLEILRCTDEKAQGFIKSTSRRNGVL